MAKRKSRAVPAYLMGRRKKKPRPRTTVRKIVNRVLDRRLEMKQKPIHVDELGIVSSGAAITIQELSKVSQGDDADERIGTKISPKGLYLNYTLHNNAAVPMYVRIVIVEARGGEGVNIASDWVLNPSTLAPTTLTAELLQDITRRWNKNDFKVIYDKVHRLAGLGDGTGIETIMRKKFFKLKGKREFLSTHDATTDSSNRNIRMIMLSRAADSDTTAATVEMTYSSVYYFQDA